MKRLLYPIFQFTSSTKQYPVVLTTYVGWNKFSQIDFIQYPTEYDYKKEKAFQLFDAQQYRESL
jgi:hypothetical protein